MSCRYESRQGIGKFVRASTSVAMNDKKSFIPLIEEHANLFGAGVLATAATDRGLLERKESGEPFKFSADYFIVFLLSVLRLIFLGRLFSRIPRCLTVLYRWLQYQDLN